MPHYFFHARNHSGAYDDEDGLECSGPDAARAAAMAGIRSIICDEASRGFIDLRGHLEVLDEAGERVLLLAYGEAVEVILADDPRS